MAQGLRGHRRAELEDQKFSSALSGLAVSV